MATNGHEPTVVLYADAAKLHQTTHVFDVQARYLGSTGGARIKGNGSTILVRDRLSSN